MLCPAHYFPAYPTAVINMWNGPVEGTPPKRRQCMKCGYSTTRKDNMERHVKAGCGAERKQGASHEQKLGGGALKDFDETDIHLTIADLVSIPSSLTKAVQAVGVIDVLVMNMHFSGHVANRNVYSATKANAFVIQGGERVERPMGEAVRAILERCKLIMADKTVRRYLSGVEIPGDAATRVAELLRTRTPRERPAYIPANPGYTPTANALRENMREYISTYELYGCVEVFREPFMRMNIEFKLTEDDDVWYRHWWVWVKGAWVYYGETETVEQAIQQLTRDALPGCNIPGLDQRVIQWYEGASHERATAMKNKNILDPLLKQQH